MNVAEMFAGVGGFRLGLQRAGHTIVWANELDKHACQIYRKNFGDKELIEGNIKTVNPETLPNFDMLCAGFPCQPFSMAGKREGFRDVRGTLFYEIARLAAARQPRVLFLENVKGLLNHDNGATFETILRTLDELGYDVEWQVFNSKYFGVPQNRERVFIIGHLRGTGGKPIFPVGCDGAEGGEIGEIANCLQGGGHSGGLHSNMTAISRTVRNGGRSSLDRHSWDVIQIKRTRADGNDMIRTYQDETPTLTSQMGTGGGNIPLVAQALQTDGFLRSGSSFGTNKPQSSRNIRRLTEKECERLQGFPDDWTKGISSTQRYKCMGNAVTVNVIEFIARRLI